MTKLEFRDLTAAEIDCRVATVNENGLTLLLYKDARCDMNILDETVGAFNWQRTHSRDNANCTVSIWDEEKKQWISKEDTGTESNTEAEKGLASDSFKRACFNWGIGRELYTAPFIWIEAGNFNKKEKNEKPACYDKFEVKDITIEEKKIVGLSINNITKKKTVYTFGKTSAKKDKPDQVNSQPVAPTKTEKKQEPVATSGSEQKKEATTAGPNRIALREYMKANFFTAEEKARVREKCGLGPFSTEKDYEMALFYAKTMRLGIEIENK